jgi:hypothetical protein
MEYIDNSHVSFALHPASFPEGHYSTVTVMAKADDAGRVPFATPFRRPLTSSCQYRPLW